MPMFRINRPSWTWFIVDVTAACVFFFVVMESVQKGNVVLFAVLGTSLAISAIRDCPVRLGNYVPSFLGFLMLFMSFLLIRAGLGYYNHGLKIAIAAFLIAAAIFFFWEQFTRKPHSENRGLIS